MGYSLANLGRDLAVGALKRNKEITEEAKNNRKEELKAKRALYIEQERENAKSRTKDYEEEMKKFKAIDSLNKRYAGEEAVNPEAYGRDYLLATNPTHFNSIQKAYATQPEKLKSIFESYGKNSNTEFKMSTTKEALDRKYREKVESITSDFNKQIKEAKGDDFLVGKAIALKNKLLGNVQEEETSGDTTGVAVAVENSNAIKQAEGLETKGAFTFGEKSASVDTFINKKSEDYKRFATENNKNAAKLNSLNVTKNSPVNGLATKQAMTVLNIPNQGDYFIYNRDDGIERFKRGGENLANTLSSTNKMKKDFLIAQGNDKLYLKFNKDSSQLVSYYGKENLNGDAVSRFKEYAVPVENGTIRKQTSFKNILRDEKNNLIVVPTGNTIDFDGTIKGTKVKVNAEIAKIAYAQSLINVSKVDNEINAKKLQATNLALESLKYGDTDNALLKEVNKEFITQYNNIAKNITKLNDNNTPNLNTNGNVKTTQKIMTVINPKTKNKKIVLDTPEARKTAEQKGFIIEEPINVPSVSQEEGITNYTELPIDRSIRKGDMRNQIRDLKNKNLYDTSITGPQRVELGKIQTEQRLKNRNNR